jgi:Outer membrane protein beta-barrel family/Carboxypeptidase regulatory-like domain
LIAFTNIITRLKCYFATAKNQTNPAMRKLIALLTGLFCLSVTSFSQTISVTGSIKDTSEKKDVKNAVIALLTPKDSILYKFTRSDAAGAFTIKNVRPGTYILMTTHPYYADFLDNIELKDAETNLGTLPVIAKSKLLQEVIIKTGAAIRIKGDTTIYTADSFRVSANANVEELLKKLPGIQVDKNGEIKAMGEKVEKVLVDGEEFFGDDPGMAVKNLRADAVKEVQVFDKKSDQAEFTGIDDGSTKKTINLKLKDDKKKGYFGKVDAAGGLLKNIDDRYNSNLLFSTFKGKRKLTAFLLSGNTGQDGLSWQDNEKYGGDNDNISMSMDDDGGMMYVWRGGGADDEPEVNTENGFIKNINAGLQYSNKWNDKQTLNISPKYNNQIYNNGQTNFTQTQIGDSILNENAATITNINRSNFKTSVTYDVKLDSNNSVKFTAKANFYHTESEENRSANTKGETGALKNITNRLLQTTSDKESFYGSVLFKHKFKKLRRTVSLNADWNLLNTNGNNYLKSFNQDFFNGTVLNENQLKESDKTTQKFSVKAVYTEPLSKKYSLEVSHEISLNNGTNNQQTYSYTSATGKYDFIVDSLTNDFKQSIVINKPAVKISFSDKKIKYFFGSGFGFTNFDFLDKTFNKDYLRNFTNFFPAAGFTYNYKSNHSLRINYNGNTTQPTLNQLQPLRDNNNFFNQYIGNPDLKPSFTNSFNLSHNGYNFLKDIWTYQSLNLRTTSNSITYNRTIDAGSGKTITQPVNTDGNISVNFWSGIGFKLKKADLRLNFNPSLGYNKFADIINSKTSFSRTLNSGLSVYLSKSKEKKYDVSISNDFSFNRNTTSQNDLVNKFYTNVARIDATVYYKKVWSLSTDYNYFQRQKTEQFNTNLNNQLWNARLKRTFKKDEFTAYILVRDILNQNIGIERNFYGNTTTEVRNDRLKRYWMIGFTWDFKNKAAKATK